MIDVAGSLTIGTILVIVLLLWRKSALALQELPMDLDLLAGEACSCPQEFVSRIFSVEDAAFLESMQSKALRRFFLHERKAVALLWVRQTSLRIRQILRDHTAVARHSENLHFLTEIGIFFRYLQLRLLCGFLFVSIALAGPIWVRGLALRADALFQRFARIRESLAAAAESPQLRGADTN
jgi:hypothetical protein